MVAGFADADKRLLLVLLQLRDFALGLGQGILDRGEVRPEVRHVAFSAAVSFAVLS